jgi:acyl-CoA thioesterase-1
MIDFSSRIRRFLLCLLLSAVPAAGQGAVILVLGDSISASYGLENASLGWVALLAERVKAAGLPWQIANASISGELSAGGLGRVDELLARHRPGLLVLELGANDGLRGLDPALTQANLSEIISRAQQAGARPVLLGMRIPPNYGKRYNDLFEAVFPAVAKAHGAAYVPFLLEGVGGNAGLTQADGLHPNALAQPVLMRRVWDALEPLLLEAAPRRGETR